MLIGCSDGGPPRVKFDGKITDGGKPLKMPVNGYPQVMFIPQFPHPTKAGRSADAATGMILDDGTFRIIGADGQGCYLGKYKVAVVMTEANGQDALKGKFDGNQTPIELEITAQTSNIEIDLSKPKG